MNTIYETKIGPPSLLLTERILLRKPRIEDAEAIFYNWNVQDATDCCGTWTPHQSIEDTCAFIIRAITAWQQRSGDLLYIIEDRQTDALVGAIELRSSNLHAELGFHIAKQYWKRGYMTEAVTALNATRLLPKPMSLARAADQRDILSMPSPIPQPLAESAIHQKRSPFHPQIDRKQPRNANRYRVAV